MSSISPKDSTELKTDSVASHPVVTSYSSIAASCPVLPSSYHGNKELHEQQTAFSLSEFRTSSMEGRRIDLLLQENERLKKQLFHVENLGRLVADCKQSNLRLSDENQELRERLDQLVEMQYKNQVWQKKIVHQHRDHPDFQHNLTMTSCVKQQIENDNAITFEQNDFNTKLPAEETGSQQICSSVTSETFSTDEENQPGPDRTDLHTDDDEDLNDTCGQTTTTTTKGQTDELPSIEQTEQCKTSRQEEEELIAHEDPDVHETRPMTIFSFPKKEKEQEDFRATQGATSKTQEVNSDSSLAEEITMFNDLLRGEKNVTNFEISQLEDMVGMANSSVNSDNQPVASLEAESRSTGSVTIQFAKLATIFARLAQRVTQSQKKVRNSQAFCDALMRENDKLKSVEGGELEKLKQSVRDKTAENKRLKQQVDACATTSGQGDSRGSQKATTKTPVANNTMKEDSTVTDHTESTKQQDSVAKDANDEASGTDLIEKLKNRVKKLEGQRKEILNVNKQWHTQYNKLREDYTAKLNAAKSEIEELKTQISGKQRENAKRRKDIDLLLKEAKKEIDILQHQKADLGKSYALEHNKGMKLNEKIQGLKSDLSCIKAENQRLNQALEAAYSIRQSRQQSTNSIYDEQQVSEPNAVSEHVESNTDCVLGLQATLQGVDRIGVVLQQEQEQEQVAGTTSEEMEDFKTQILVLQQQVKIYREDFETERRDREKNQAEKQRLSEEMTRMRDEMRALNQQVRAHEQDFRQERREKQRLQRHLSRIQMHVASVGNTNAVGLYYGVDDVEDIQQTDRYVHHHHHIQPNPDIQRTERDFVLHTTASPTGTARRFAAMRTRSNPPPYSTRHQRRQTNTAGPRIRDGYLEPTPYHHDPEVVYPPETGLNQL